MPLEYRHSVCHLNIAEYLNWHCQSTLRTWGFDTLEEGQVEHAVDDQQAEHQLPLGVAHLVQPSAALHLQHGAAENTFTSDLWRFLWRGPLWESGESSGPRLRNISLNAENKTYICIIYIYVNIYSPLVTICTASLAFNNSTFCPHSEFMCFVWIWEQTAIISLYNINWLVCITEI